MRCSKLRQNVGNIIGGRFEQIVKYKGENVIIAAIAYATTCSMLNPIYPLMLYSGPSRLLRTNQYPPRAET